MRTVLHEIDYLAGNQQSIESLRDLHDRTGVPVVMVGMAMADKKLIRYKHLFDRISEVLKFTAFDLDDVKMIVEQLSEVGITAEAIEFIHQKANRFRQIVKLISKAEQIAEANNLQELYCGNPIGQELFEAKRILNTFEKVVEYIEQECGWKVID